MKKMLAVLLALVLVLSMVPAAAFAAQPVAESGTLSGGMANPLYSRDEKTLSGWQSAEKKLSALSGGITAQTAASYEPDLDKAAAELDFEKAAELRDKIIEIKKNMQED